MTRATHIQNYRKAHKLTLAEFGKLCGVTGGAVWAWEHGATPTRADHKKKIHALLYAPALNKGEVFHQLPTATQRELERVSIDQTLLDLTIAILQDIGTVTSRTLAQRWQDYTVKDTYELRNTQ